MHIFSQCWTFFLLLFSINLICADSSEVLDAALPWRRGPSCTLRFPSCFFLPSKAPLIGGRRQKKTTAPWSQFFSEVFFDTCVLIISTNIPYHTLHYIIYTLDSRSPRQDYHAVLCHRFPGDVSWFQTAPTFITGPDLCLWDLS